MNDFVKAAAIALISVILCQVLAKQNKDISSLLCLAACALIAIVALLILIIFLFVKGIIALIRWIVRLITGKPVM